MAAVAAMMVAGCCWLPGRPWTGGALLAVATLAFLLPSLRKAVLQAATVARREFA
jgi:hypothetical protein